MVRVRVWVRVRVRVKVRIRVRVSVKVRVSFSVCKSTSGLHSAPAPTQALTAKPHATKLHGATL